ncbi:cobalt-zinc-cadmium efflux system membrane fusion protein [Povalibacter uvarum]|uniref:Cobalt-zinc-cadmium efflux system membrane fusion protein n=1 Tax=Povalibacter uvarum TaxID=732238 RepID=A0A841HP97_9GAMM|nr:efflux RND transporter periplasmic adaptor subunit [Povalibacter uvarum]MBB6094967.1 cobalt-zinc-cadmium efflux system membrane fusion protein [Povalibacter uvarum]
MNTKVMLIALLVTLAGCGSESAPQKPSASAEHSAEDEGHEEDGDQHEESGEGRVALSEEQVKTAGIGLEQVGPAAIRETLPVYGAIAPNAERVRDVGARFPGIIRNVSKKIGDEVRQGETLATVESNESLQTYPVVAPLSGTVIARNANSGEQTGEKVLFAIADLSTVWVELSLFPRDIAKVKVGQIVQVGASDPGLQGEGKIVYVAPFGTSANQTLTARVLLDNKERRWAPGLYVTANVTLSQSPVPLAVRSDALQSWEENTVVFVRGDEGFEPRPVQSGRTDGQWVEITQGLQAGETYAAANSFIVKAELGKGSAEHGH